MSANPATSIDTAKVLGHFINGIDVADTNRPAPVNDPATGDITKYVAMAASDTVTAAICISDGIGTAVRGLVAFLR